ncbi:septal ring lytic transglycosylase RlpA family protein [Neolewinella lacunae]|uniref:Probable endolytic peptidoglycan transglycosylase RlpA n=1 Tax=Neolewinella lacunae TaxID=1517758 RepID=A0A923T7L0_9BACT|nr:septal ring lytic transglycosylase RlpA family protein [Neolewinella lacunae]MBC6993656.1 septal ring lytic transglycosylase RlpA family protein [Neolewinella lacunae]MDN3634716.1 septal ring lytic transglycosylase RlpA family protein [Neolewinella lacunae]
MRHLLILLVLAICSSYLPAQLVGDTENGLASYYSAEYHGAETAYGVIYDKNQLVAAHRQFPQNSVVRVRNIENGKTVDVRIIDKGPFIRGRVIELSERAAANLGMLGKETVPVEITLLSTPSQPAAVNTDPPRQTPVVPEATPATPVTRPTTEPAATPATDTRVVTPEPARPAPVQPGEVTPRSTPSTTAPISTPPPTVSAADAVKATPVVKKNYVRQNAFAPGTYKIELLKPSGGNFGVQVGSFKDLEGSMDKVAELQGKWFENILVQKINSGPFATYKVILGPFDTQASATRYASDLKKRYKMDGFTVTLE